MRGTLSLLTNDETALLATAVSHYTREERGPARAILSLVEGVRESGTLEAKLQLQFPSISPDHAAVVLVLSSYYFTRSLFVAVWDSETSLLHCFFCFGKFSFLTLQESFRVYWERLMSLLRTSAESYFRLLGIFDSIDSSTSRGELLTPTLRLLTLLLKHGLHLVRTLRAPPNTSSSGQLGGREGTVCFMCVILSGTG